MDKAELKKVVRALSECAQHDPEFFSDWEQGFIQSFAERVEKYGDNVYCSDKQKAALKKLVDKMKER